MQTSPLLIETEREVDGRWLAELRSYLASSLTVTHAKRRLPEHRRSALRVPADRLEHGEAVPELKGLFDAA